jgi:alkylation response protein AidB-like acyl-CoA dehydrogenase
MRALRPEQLERYVRDARILRLYESSSEIQKTIIVRSLWAEQGVGASVFENH